MSQDNIKLDELFEGVFGRKNFFSGNGKTELLPLSSIIDKVKVSVTWFPITDFSDANVNQLVAKVNQAVLFRVKWKDDSRPVEICHGTYYLNKDTGVSGWGVYTDQGKITLIDTEKVEVTEWAWFNLTPNSLF